MSSFPTTLSSASSDLLRTVLDVSLAAVALMRPVYGPDNGAIVGFAVEYQNAAAQEYQEVFGALGGKIEGDNSPTVALPSSVFAFCQRVFTTGEAERYVLRNPAAGSVLLAAQRSGELLVVSAEATSADVRAAEFAPQPNAGAQHQELLRLNQELQAQMADQTQETQLARAATERQRRQLESLFMRAPAAICILSGPDLVYELVNPGYQQMFYGRELLGLPVLQALPELADQPIMDIIREVYATGLPYEGKEVLVPLARTADGPIEDIYFNLTYQARFDEEGRVNGFVNYAYDVTEQVLARQQRSAQERQLQEVFAQAPVAICVFRGPDYMLDVVNESMSKLWGRPLDELLNRPYFEAMPDLEGQGLREILDQVRLSGVPYLAQEREVVMEHHRPGEMHFYDFVCQPLLDAYGQRTAITCVATEVTAQVLARRVVEEREESFRLMADNAPAMLWVTDPKGYCTYLNQPWYAFTGQTEVEALGLGWVDAVHPDDSEKAGAAFLDANARQVPFHCLYRLRRRDGAYRWAIDSGVPRFSTGGKFEGIVGTVIDVHEQKMAELALQRLTKKLRTSRDQAQALNVELQASNTQLTRTNIDLDNFIYTASHDLKSPITNIEGLLFALDQQLPAVSRDQEVTSMLDMMHESVVRFKRTINHLSDVVKLQKEHEQLPSDVLLAPVVEDVRLDLLPLSLQVGAHLVVEVDPALSVSFSAKNLRSVIYNLISNALKYSHPHRKPHVRIWSQQEGEYSVLSVQDNGLGLDAAQRAELFTMFRRLHTHVEGTGIGLYMVKRSVENAGGKVQVTSELDEGSTFSVYFRR